MALSSGIFSFTVCARFAHCISWAKEFILVCVRVLVRALSQWEVCVGACAYWVEVCVLWELRKTGSRIVSVGYYLLNINWLVGWTVDFRDAIMHFYSIVHNF